MLTERERTDARRFLGYPAHGADLSGAMSWWFVQAGGTVEYRLNNLTASEETVLRGFLTTLAGLEQAIPDTGAGLDTASAAGWVRNPRELQDRERLFDQWRRRLCGFLGVSPGSNLSGGSSVVLVV
jgi:hypothetical protein